MRHPATVSGQEVATKGSHGEGKGLLWNAEMYKQQGARATEATVVGGPCEE